VPYTVESAVNAFRVAAGLLLVPVLLQGQAVDESIAKGIEAQRAREPMSALAYLENALEIDSTNYEANWRAAEVLMDIGKQTPDSVKSPERDSVYRRAETLARRAVTVNPGGADGHYALASAIGRASLTKGKKERVKRAGEIRSEALRALEIDPQQHQAMHVLGRWNAEIMRLSGLERFFAKNFLGGSIFNAAAWDSAFVYMDRALAISPENIYHHLDLAEMLIDRHRYSEARIHLRQVESLPIYDVMDPAHQRRAAALLARIEGKKDKD
jgi:tetratricopeptide (TPR) repeat protein